MEYNDIKKAYGREDLKKNFRNGSIPSETHFSSLIDSMINKQDDGFSKDEENGFIVKTTGASSRLLSLYKNINDLSPFFTFEKDEKENTSLKLNPEGNTEVDSADEKSFFLGINGNMGIGTRPEPHNKLEVNGFMASKGRIGTYASGQVPADGQWHTIIEGLDYCNAFEIIARTGKKNSGRFAILHAHALSAYGNSHSRIRRTSAHYGFFWNKIKLRWRGTTHNYYLQIKTGSNYGSNVDIFYKITQLWNDEVFLPDTDFYY